MSSASVIAGDHLHLNRSASRCDTGRRYKEAVGFDIEGVRFYQPDVTVDPRSGVPARRRLGGIVRTHGNHVGLT